MVLAHQQRHAAFPAAEQIAKSAVSVAIRMCSAALFPKYLQRHVFALQLPRHRGPVRFRQLAPPPRHAGGTIQTLLQIRVTDLGRNRPRQSRALEAYDHVAHRRSRKAGQPGDLAHRDTCLPMHSHHFAHLAHLRPPRRHSILRLLCRQDGLNERASHSLPGGRELLGMVAGISSESRPGSNRNAGRDVPGIRTCAIFCLRRPKREGLNRHPTCVCRQSDRSAHLATFGGQTSGCGGGLRRPLRDLWASHGIPREVTQSRSTSSRIIITGYY